MSPLRTYLVEDSPIIRDNLIATLEELSPVRVVGTASGETEALDWLQCHPTDLVIVDLFLTGGSGLGVLRSRQASVRCVVLSNYVNPAMRARCLALGADRVFDKSTEIDDLIAYCGALAVSAARPGLRPPPLPLS